MKDSDQPSLGPEQGGRLGALATLAQRVLIVERVWPPLVFALAVVILFLAASWLGVWQFAPRSFRIAGVVLFAVACGIALAPLARLRRPAPRDVLARLDRDAGANHRPASSLADSLANDDGDPGTQAMWAAHRARLERAVDGIRVASPSPRMAERDPYAIRFGVALLAFAAAVAAGPETYGRLAAAFDWRSDEAIAAAAASRIDAWIDPPPYAGRPPVVIDFKTAAPQTLNIPEDSILVVRGDPSLVETRIEGAISPSDQKDEVPEKTRTEKRWTIHGVGKATILRSGAPVAVAILAVAPAGAPTIATTEEPRANISGSLTLSYHVDDRFGLAGARADFARPHDGAAPAPRTLAPPPQAALQLPPTANGVGDAKTTVDLSEHPWAGAKVTMTLSAVSISGKTGQSGPIEMTLPQRIFHNPLARALVEQRRALILDPDNAPKRVETALTGLAIAPELFDTPAKIYLGLKQANASLHDAKSDADLLDVAAMLWAMALQIEDGDASQAERDLRAAEQALREALQRGASDQEIRKLMDQLREAAKRFMSEMARNNQPDANAQDQNLQAQDLDKLLDQMEDKARNGSREDAQAMLDQMQEMFENMRSARDGEESPGEREMRKQIGELEKLLHDQQALRDDTFRSDQRDRTRKRAHNRAAPGQDDQQAQPDEDGSNAPDEGDNDADSSAKPDQDQADQDALPLDERQGALRDRLAELQRKLKSLGMKGEKGFDDAQGDMKEAEGDLSGDQGKPGKDGQGGKGKGGKGAAVDAQGRALEALREGAQGLGKQMQSQGQGQGRNGKGNYVARRTRPGEPPGDDPLGRGAEGDKGREDGPLKETAGAAERARRVMEELRRRLADPARPVDERDYLERLMKRD
ncbi:TIGR02302 family protein [Roseiarcus sp.]|uniref:TIGR02302 family protein n=1 Tax=Roseiarcus sp. TaxID=1969460 RepID=UPI003D0E6F2D